MSDDDILDIAYSIDHSFIFADVFDSQIIDFARAIAAKEREACAVLCDEVYRAGRVHQAQDCAEAIRARGE